MNSVYMNMVLGTQAYEWAAYAPPVGLWNNIRFHDDRRAGPQSQQAMTSTYIHGEELEQD